MSDVSSNAPTNGQVLAYNSSTGEWVPADNRVNQNIADLDDVTGSPLNGYFLQYNSSNLKWEAVAVNITELADVSSSTPSNNQILVYDSDDGYYKPVTQKDDLVDLNDVSSVGLANNKSLVYQSDTASWIPANNVQIFSDLADVQGSPSSGQTITWNGSAWIPADVGAINLLSDIVNVSNTAPADGQIIKYIGSSNRWEPTNLSTVDLTNVTSDVPGAGQALVFDGSNYKPTSVVSTTTDLTDVQGVPTDGQVLAYDNNSSKYLPSTPVTELKNLTNVSNTTPTTGQVLKYSGSEWAPSADDNLTLGTGDAQAMPGNTSIPSTINTLSDVHTATPSNGQALLYDSDNSRYSPGTVARQIGDLFDVSNTGISNGQVYSFRSDTETYVPEDLNRKISDQDDVSTVGLGVGQVLAWDGTQWAPVNRTDSSTSLDLDDIDTTNLQEGQLLRYNATSSKWENVYLDLRSLNDVDITSLANGTVAHWDQNANKFIFEQGIKSIEDLDNVTNTNITTGDTLVWNGSSWNPGSTSSTLNDLTDVDLSTPATSGQILKFNGTQFVPAAAAGVTLGTGDNDAMPGNTTIPSTISSLTDVHTTAPGNGQVLAYSSDNSRYEPLSPVQEVGDLTDVSNTGIANGDVLAFDNVTETYKPYTPKKKISQLEDVSSALPSNGQVLQYSESTQNWEPANNRVNVTLNDLDNVNNAVQAANNSVLKWSNTDLRWEPGELSTRMISDIDTNLQATNGHVITYISDENIYKPAAAVREMGDLGDVSNTGIANGDILSYRSDTESFLPDQFPRDLSGLIDVANNIGSGIANQSVLAWSTVANSWTSMELGTQVQISSLKLIGDVSNTTPSNGQVLAYSADANQWSPGASIPTKVSDLLNDSAFITASSLPTQLSDFSEVDVSTMASPSDGDVFRYNASESLWKATALPDLLADLVIPANTTDLGDVTSFDLVPPSNGQIMTWNSESGQWYSANNVLNVSELNNDAAYILSLIHI